jgi:hypothetical protein
LPFRNRYARVVQQPGYALAGHLPLEMQHQRQTMKMRPAAPDHARRRRRRHDLACARLAALAPVERRLRAKDDVLDDRLYMPLWREPAGALTGSVNT